MLTLDDGIFNAGQPPTWHWYMDALHAPGVVHHVRVAHNNELKQTQLWHNNVFLWRCSGLLTPAHIWPMMTTILMDQCILCMPLQNESETLALPDMDTPCR